MLVQQFESTKKETDTTFIYPQYDKNCILKIPNTVLHLLGAENDKTGPPLENALNSVCSEGINKVVF